MLAVNPPIGQALPDDATHSLVEAHGVGHAEGDALIVAEIKLAHVSGHFVKGIIPNKKPRRVRAGPVCVRGRQSGGRRGWRGVRELVVEAHDRVNKVLNFLGDGGKVTA